MLLLHCIVFRKFHVTDSQNMHDHITSDSRSRNMHDQIVFCAFHLFFSGSPNECWLHTYDECVITTWRLGLQVTRGASKNALSKRIIVITLA